MKKKLHGKKKGRKVPGNKDLHIIGVAIFL